MQYCRRCGQSLERYRSAGSPARPAASAATPSPHRQVQESASAHERFYDSGIFLLPDEEQVHTALFTPQFLLPHLTSRLVLTKERLLVRHPHTAFVLFPVGYAVSVATLNKIEQVNVGTVMRPGRVAAGVFVILLAFYSMLGFGGGGSGVRWISLFMLLVFIGIGIALVVTARSTAIVAHTGGSTLTVVGQSRERPALEETAYRISAAIREAKPTQ